MAKRRFDQKNNRVDYGELLIEDPDYELDQAVGMTYSLDMEALMGVLLCLDMCGEMDSGQRNNPFCVLRADSHIRKKLSIFCNAGHIKVPKTESKLYALLEESIHEVRLAKSTYNFHPKLWILQYHNIYDGTILIKLVVLSRNLTFDQSMDMAIEMSGFVGSEVNPKNQPIADMLTFVSQFDSRKNAYQQLISNVKRVEAFQLLDCFEDYEFHPFGIYGKSENGIKKVTSKQHRKTARELFQNCDALFMISPFLSEGVIGELWGDKDDSENVGPTSRCLITRETSVTNRIYKAFNRNEKDDGIWIMNSALSSNDALEDGATYGDVNRDIHAKVYYTEKYDEPHKLYVGSLNASQNAFDHNVEFLLELQYKNYHSSYRSIKEDFIPNEECPFVPLNDWDETINEPEKKEVDFRAEVYGIQRAEIIAVDSTYTIKVYADDDFENVTIRPFYVKTDIQPLKQNVEFKDVPLKNLSNMFILTKDGAERLIRLEATGMPADEREDAIFNEIISNRSVFMTYMRYLLDEDDYDSRSLEELAMGGTAAGNGTESYGFSTESDLYEKMLRAAANHPEQLDSMFEVTERLDDDKIGEDFRQLLELFMKATGRKGKGRR